MCIRDRNDVVRIRSKLLLKVALSFKRHLTLPRCDEVKTLALYLLFLLFSFSISLFVHVGSFRLTQAPVPLPPVKLVDGLGNWLVTVNLIFYRDHKERDVCACPSLSTSPLSIDKRRS